MFSLRCNKLRTWFSEDRLEGTIIPGSNGASGTVRHSKEQLLFHEKYLSSLLVVQWDLPPL